MNKTIITAFTLILAGLLFTACEKSKEPEGKKEGLRQQTRKEEVKQQPSESQTKQEQPPIAPDGKEREKEKPAGIKESLLTEEEQKSFEGGWIEPGDISQKKALKYLHILLKGSPDAIKWYKEHKGSADYGIYRESRLLYQVDICSMTQALAKKENKEGFDQILQVIKQKSEYPKARACAAEVIGWYGKLKNGQWQGNKKAIPVLKEIISDKDPEVRLQASGTLLSLGEAAIALPVLDDLAKAKIHQSTFALNKLFAPEEIEDEGKKRIVVSHTKLYDARGKEILVRALNYPTNETRAFAAARLADMGERALAEPVLLNILKRLKDMRLKEYGLTEEDYDKYGKGGKEGAYEKHNSDHRALGTAINTLGELKSKQAIPYLKEVIMNPEASYIENWAKKALENIQQGNRRHP